MAVDDTLVRLLTATARQDRLAFDRLYAEAGAKLFAVALRMLNRRDWAEEVLQASRPSAARRWRG
jgi:RNA polymerase sigma-70 factor (ECF subfamily)